MYRRKIGGLELLMALGFSLGTAALAGQVGGGPDRVRPILLPDRRVRVEILPQVSYRSDTGDGLTELVEASAEVLVQPGQPILLGGGSTRNEVIGRFLLGHGAVHRTGKIQFVLNIETPRAARSGIPSSTDRI